MTEGMRDMLLLIGAGIKKKPLGENRWWKRYMLIDRGGGYYYYKGPWVGTHIVNYIWIN